MKLDSIDIMIEHYEQNSIHGGIIIKNEVSFEKIKMLIEKIDLEKAYIYLYYDKDIGQNFIEKLDVNINQQEIPKRVRMVFNDLETIFSNHKYYYPETFVGMSEEEIYLLQVLKENQIEQIRNQLDDFYRGKKLTKVVLNEKFKLLSIVSKEAQDFPRDIAEALHENGVQCETIIKQFPNKYSYHWDEFSYMHILNEFRPDAIFTIFTTKKAMKYYVPEQMIVFTELDIFANLIFNHNKFLDGLDKYNICMIPAKTADTMTGVLDKDKKKWNDRTVSFVFSCNNSLFRRLRISEQERKLYESDICVIGGYHSESQFWIEVDRQYHMNSLANDLYVSIMDSYKNITDKIKDKVYKGNKLIQDRTWYRKIVSEEFLRKGIRLTEEELEQNCWVFMFDYEAWLMSGNLLENLLETKHRIVFWGVGYQKLDKFKPYSRGLVDNGTELAKIYNTSKICVNVNVLMGLHRRFFESTLCGCLCMTYKPVVEYNTSNPDLYFVENESIVYYSTKEELLEKIDFYIMHEEERVRIVENAINVMEQNKLYTSEIWKRAFDEGIDKINKIIEME